MTEAADIRAQAAKRLLQLRDAEESFLGFVKLHRPSWNLSHFQLDLIDKLDKLGKRQLEHPDVMPLLGGPYPPERRGRKVRSLLVTMPPRHAKSALCTVLFPAWMMCRSPMRYIMSSSYNAILAADFGRQVRDLMDDTETRIAFPEAKLSQDSRASDVWRTEKGGAYFGIGIGGTTTGRPANLLIIDDPVKSREDADSPTIRRKTWDFYSSNLSTRLQPEDDGSEPIQLVVLTRWHPDDLAGRLMDSEDWKDGRWLHINYPAIVSDSSTNPPTERALWPERFPLEELQRRRRINEREFASLYQQTPYVEGGNIIKSKWWRHYPDDVTPTNFQQIIIAADTAFRKGDQNDYSVFIVAGLDNAGDIYILDVIRGRYDFPDLKQRAIMLNNKYRGRGLRGFYIEDRASGQSLIQELRRESGISVIPYAAVRDKVVRVQSVTPLIEGGRVFLPPQAPWLDDFITECQAFPSSPYDDQVDTLAIALDVLSRQTITPDDIFGDFTMANSLNALARKKSPELRKSLSNMVPGGFRWGE